MTSYVRHFIKMPGEFLQLPPHLLIVQAVPMGEGFTARLALRSPKNIDGESVLPFYSGREPMWMEVECHAVQQLTPRNYWALYRAATLRSFGYSGRGDEVVRLRDNRLCLATAAHAWHVYWLVNQLAREHPGAFRFLAHGLLHKAMKFRPMDPEDILKKPPYEFTDPDTEVVKVEYLPLLFACICKTAMAKSSLIHYATTPPFARKQ